MSWNRLSMAEKANIMKLAVESGIYDLDTIRNEYNTFAGGGSTKDDDLVDWIIKEEGFNTKPEDIGDGKMTLGSGLTAQKWHNLYKQRGNKWSAADNRKAVAEEVANRRRWAEKTIPNWDSLPASSQKALLSYKYNYDFTPANSPKLFQALKDSNLREAARQMDATSKDPKFRKGLAGRRQREQQWFLSEVSAPQAVPVPSYAAPAVSTQVVNPYIMQSQNEPIPTKMIPNEGSYVEAHRLTPSEDRINRFQERMEAISDYNRVMKAVGLSNPLEKYVSMSGLLDPDILDPTYAKGGKIHIDPSKKGTFTAAASKHGKSVQAFASKVLAHPENYSPAMRKKANFARNARKWKHGDGGNIYPGGGFMGMMPAMPGIIAVKEGKDFLSKAYHGLKQFIGLEDTEEELRRKRSASRYDTNGYIGGEPRDTRQKYFDVDKEFTDSVNSISKRYGLDPSVVASRIAEEGPVDQAIIEYNDENNVGTQGQILSDNGRGTHGPLWGLDDFYTRVNNDDVKVTTTAPHTYKKQRFINEKGRETESITSPQWWFGIEATAAEMKARRDKLKKNNSWMNNHQLDAATAMSFNYGETRVQNHINSKKSIPKRFNPYIKTK